MGVKVQVRGFVNRLIPLRPISCHGGGKRIYIRKDGLVSPYIRRTLHGC